MQIRNNFTKLFGKSKLPTLGLATKKAKTKKIKVKTSKPKISFGKSKKVRVY